jgi:hypothetical protein
MGKKATNDQSNLFFLAKVCSFSFSGKMIFPITRHVRVEGMRRVNQGK